MITARDEAARDAIVDHHRELVAGVEARVGQLGDAVTNSRPHLLDWADLLAYLGAEILPHAVAEEQTLYQAAGRDGLADQIAAMTDEHRQLAETVDALAHTTDPHDALRHARHFQAIFTTHVDAENNVVLPALLAGETSLAALLEAMHEAYHAAKLGTGAHGEAGDVAAVLQRLLTVALRRLARGGHADEACRIGASAWSQLRVGRPDLASRTTALLHQLARHEGATTVPTVLVTEHPDPELDVRDLPPARRHEIIFSTYHALPPAAGFVLVNDHDPKPLQYQFAAEHNGQYTWDELQTGPEVWKVRIGKTALVATPA
jgi:uncharacterized protein (DUF2249 family)